MKANWKGKVSALAVLAVSLIAQRAGYAQAIPFAEDGTLKMLYDNRMYPQAVECDGTLYIVWRGAKGLPHIISYDVSTATYSDPVMLLDSLALKIDTQKYERDHHYAPVLWIDGNEHLHVLFGCHGNSGGVHLVSAQPKETTRWLEGSTIYSSISYPQVHQIDERRSLVYFRDRGHLGSWTYRASSDNGKTWTGSDKAVVDLNIEPNRGYLASHAGSYQTTRISRDGRRLHVAFTWKVEEPVPNRRYHDTLGDHIQRYNLYYLYVDLVSGQAYNCQGRKLDRPIDKWTADHDCLVWDTEERVAAVPPSIFLDENDKPYFVLPVSAETPFKCWYYCVRYQQNQWRRTAIARTPHPFNACQLTQDPAGDLLAYLVTGDGESVPRPGMDLYGWGDKVELWRSNDDGASWKLEKNLTPASGLRYQNVQFVWSRTEGPLPHRILFYAWKSGNGPGTGFLWMNRVSP